CQQTHRVYHRPDIVDTHQSGTPQDSVEHRSQCPFQAIPDLALEQASQKRFARRTDQQRLAQGVKMLQTVQEVKIMLHGLTETEARIEHNALPRHAMLHRTVETFSQETVHVIEHVSVRWGL